MGIAPKIKGLGVEHDTSQVLSSHALGRCRRRSCRVHPFSGVEDDKVDNIPGPLATELFAINE
jgi:hypothetical protein